MHQGTIRRQGLVIGDLFLSHVERWVVNPHTDLMVTCLPDTKVVDITYGLDRLETVLGRSQWFRYMMVTMWGNVVV